MNKLIYNLVTWSNFIDLLSWFAERVFLNTKVMRFAIPEHYPEKKYLIELKKIISLKGFFWLKQKIFLN